MLGVSGAKYSRNLIRSGAQDRGNKGLLMKSRRGKNWKNWRQNEKSDVTKVTSLWRIREYRLRTGSLYPWETECWNQCFRKQADQAVKQWSVFYQDGEEQLRSLIHAGSQQRYEARVKSPFIFLHHYFDSCFFWQLCAIQNPNQCVVNTNRCRLYLNWHTHSQQVKTVRLLRPNA